MAAVPRCETDRDRVTGRQREADTDTERHIELGR